MARNRFLRVAGVASLAGLAALVIFGCGGGGGSSSDGGNTTATSATGTTSGSVVNVALVPVFQGTQSPADVGSTAATITLGAGDRIEFEYIGVESTNSTVYKVVSGGTLSTTAPSSVATLSGTVLSVTGSSGSTVYKVTGSFGGKTLSSVFLTTTALAKTSGVVIDPSGNPLVGVPVNLYSGNIKVASTTTGIDGSFIGEAPATANGVSVDFTQFPTYYNEYAYGNLDFSAATAGCYTSLPTLTAGKTVALPNQFVPFYFDSNSPPPPPTGCN